MVVVRSCVLGIPYLLVFVFGYESWVGRFIASGYIWTVVFLIICTFLVFAPSQRLITPEAKLRHLKSDTPRRVVEIVGRTLGAGLAIFFIVRLINYGLDTREILYRHGRPTISGKLTGQSYTALAWVCYQNITIVRPDGSTENYSLFFHRAFLLGEIASFVFCVDAKLFFRLRPKSYLKSFATGSLASVEMTSYGDFPE